MLETDDRPKIVGFVTDGGGMDMTLVSSRPEDKNRLKEAIATFTNRHEPTYLDCEYGTSTRETPDGDLTRHVVIWHARWDHGEGSPPVLDFVSRH